MMGIIRKYFSTNDNMDEPPDDREDEFPEEPLNNKPNRVIGRITHVNEEKGYGFITTPEIKFTKIFFHWSSLERDTLHFTQLRKGMRVEFTPKEYPDTGFRAIKLRVLTDE